VTFGFVDLRARLLLTGGCVKGSPKVQLLEAAVPIAGGVEDTAATPQMLP
jgi:hypothetical protein